MAGKRAMSKHEAGLVLMHEGEYRGIQLRYIDSNYLHHWYYQNISEPKRCPHSPHVSKYNKVYRNIMCYTCYKSYRDLEPRRNCTRYAIAILCGL